MINFESCLGFFLPWWGVWEIITIVLAGCLLWMVALRTRELDKKNRLLQAEIDERKRVEAELRRSQERHRNFIANSSEQIWCFEFDEPISTDLPEMEQVELIYDRGFCTEANEAVAVAHGTTVEGFIGRRVHQIIPKSLPTSIPFLQGVIRSGYRMVDQEMHELDTLGRKVIMLSSFIGTVEEGKLLRIWGTTQDITETRRTEEQNVLHSAAVETMNDGMAIVDVRKDDQPIVYVNPQFCTISGYSAAESLGRNCRFLQGPDSSPETARKIRVAIASGRDFDGELLNYRKDGTSFWNHLRLTPVHDEAGQLTHFVEIQADISEQRRAGALRKKHRNELAHASRVATMGGLTAAIAHELNQPLAAIGANAQAARRFLSGVDPKLSEIDEILADIVSDNQRAAEVIRRMRNLLKKRVGDDESLNLNQLIRGVETLVHSDAILRKVSVELELEESIPWVSAGRTEIQQVLLNFIINGFDAMSDAPEDGRRLVIRTQAVDAGRVQVSVIDRGSGIEDAVNVFESFHTTKPDGLGMGLSINKTIVQSYGGSIWAEKNAGPGSSFHFALPGRAQ
jgi:PAS domain S-box-containing protein